MPNSTSILIVDDDKAISKLLSLYLSKEGYRISTASSGSEMHALEQQHSFDLYILDIGLPDTDGMTLARTIRARGNTPIIMLTGKTDPVDKILGLELGADDYVTKPFDERELLARVHSVLRRAGPGTAPQEESSTPMRYAQFGQWRLDLEGFELFDSEGEKVPLTHHEFMLLKLLLEHANRVLTRSQILDRLSDREWSPYDRSIDVLVGKLRKKLNDNTTQPSLIKTLRGLGYKMVTRVSYSDK